MVEQAREKVVVRFYRTAAGAEPVLDWLRALDKDDRQLIGQDLARVQYGWPIGMPLCRSLGDGLWEVRSTLTGKRIARLLFFFHEQELGLVHGFYQEDPEDTAHRHGVSTEANEGDGRMTRNKHWGSSLDDWLKEEGIYEKATTAAVKSVLAYQLADEMKKRGITKKRMAELMQTSRAQVDRVLDPENGSATIETLQRAAKVVGRQLRLELV